MAQPARHLHLVDSEAPQVAAQQFNERRYHQQTTPPIVGCRVCWSPMVVTTGGLEMLEGHVYHRCPHCGGVSLIRRNDPDTLESGAAVTNLEPRPVRRLSAKAGLIAVLTTLALFAIAWIALTVRMIMWIFDG